MYWVYNDKWRPWALSGALLMHGVIFRYRPGIKSVNQKSHQLKMKILLIFACLV